MLTCKVSADNRLVKAERGTAEAICLDKMSDSFVGWLLEATGSCVDEPFLLPRLPAAVVETFQTSCTPIM